MKHHLYRILALCLVLCALLTTVAVAAEEPAALETTATENVADITEATPKTIPDEPSESAESSEPEEFSEPTEPSDSTEPTAPTDPTDTYVFPDNWSRDAMIFAVKNGILAGDDQHNLNPDKNITRAEMAAVLVRMLRASGSANLSAYKDVPTSAWYYKELSAAVDAGIFTGTSATKMEPKAFLSREQAVVVLARAFGIADTDCTGYKKFKDAQKISSYAQCAVSALKNQGLISGYSDGGVHPQSKITRAEIAQLIYNMFDCIADTPEDIPASGRVLYRGTEALPDPFALDGSLVIGQPYTGALSPSDWNISGTLSIRCGTDTTADFSNISVGQLVFAPTSGKLTASTDTVFLSGAITFVGNTKALTILSGNSNVTGSCDALDLRDGAYLVMTGDVSGNITAGSRSALVLYGNAGSISAKNSFGLSITGDVNKITLGSKCNIHCYGSVNSISIGESCRVTLDKDMDTIEIKSNNVHLTLNGRVKKVYARAQNTVIDGNGRIGELSYFRSTKFTIACDKTVDLWKEEFDRDYNCALATVQTLKIPFIATTNTALYQNSNGTGYLKSIAKGETVYNENGPNGAYMRVSNSKGQYGWVLRSYFKIDAAHQIYKGKYDYSDGTKTGFVNLRGYSSPTKYLIWISRYTQKIVIYTGSKGNWKIYKTCPCSTGSPFTPTPGGTFSIYSKTWIWNFENFYVNNVSLFYGGVAFHSYLLDFNGSIYDSTLGVPLSHGCIRLNPADASFIYKSVPLKTTVVVY